MECTVLNLRHVFEHFCVLNLLNIQQMVRMSAVVLARFDIHEP